MSFTKAGSLDSQGAPVMRNSIITNSVALVVSDSVKNVSGFLALGTAGVAVFGHVDSIVTFKDTGMETTGVAGSESGSYVGAFTAASDNQTVAKVSGKCDISQETLYSAELDATIGTTTGSNLLNYRLDLIDEDTLDESSAVTTTAQYYNWGVDPLNSARIIVSIFESEVFNT